MRAKDYRSIESCHSKGAASRRVRGSELRLWFPQFAPTTPWRIVSRGLPAEGGLLVRGEGDGRVG